MQTFTKLLIKEGDKTPAYMYRFSAVLSNQSFSFLLFFFFCFTHSDHEGNSADHLQNEGDM